MLSVLTFFSAYSVTRQLPPPPPPPPFLYIYLFIYFSVGACCCCYCKINALPWESVTLSSFAPVPSEWDMSRGRDKRGLRNSVDVFSRPRGQRIAMCCIFLSRGRRRLAGCCLSKPCVDYFGRIDGLMILPRKKAVLFYFCHWGDGYGNDGDNNSDGGEDDHFLYWFLFIKDLQTRWDQ